MSRYRRTAPPHMRFVVYDLTKRTNRRPTKLGHVSLSVSEGFDPLTLDKHEHIAKIEEAAHALKHKYERKEACGLTLKTGIRVELAE